MADPNPFGAGSDTDSEAPPRAKAVPYSTVDLGHTEDKEWTPPERDPKTAFLYFKEIYSTILLIFCTVVVMTYIFYQNTTLSQKSPWIAFFIFWPALYWLSMVEGGQASLVGLPPVDTRLFKKSHPTTYKIMEIINKGDTLDRYLMGRQFMVLALVFVESLCAGAVDPSILVLGMPIIVNKMFIDTGLAVFFMTAMIGKISAQVNASRCMLDYVNNQFALFTMQTARLIEASGLLHICYVVQMIFANISGQPLESKEAPRTETENLFFWGRVAISGAILCFAFAVTIDAILNGQTTMWEGVPPWLTIILFFVFMSIVGMLEGMQIAFFAVARMTEEERSRSAWAKKTCELLFRGEGRNLPSFMIGRQMTVTLCFFIIARVTTVKLQPGDENIFGVSDGAQAFFETGLLGALITTIVASIVWQLVATAFPMAFLSTPLTYILLVFSLGLEWTGLCQGSWVIARVQRKFFSYFKRDEYYIGTAEERKARALADPEHFHEDYEVQAHGTQALVMTKVAGGLNRTMEDIQGMEDDLMAQRQEIRNRLAELDKEKQAMKEKIMNW